MTMARGIQVGLGDRADEEVLSKWEEISDRDGDIVPEAGNVQGHVELSKDEAAGPDIKPLSVRETVIAKAAREPISNSTSQNAASGSPIDPAISCASVSPGKVDNIFMHAIENCVGEAVHSTNQRETDR